MTQPASGQQQAGSGPQQVVLLMEVPIRFVARPSSEPTGPPPAPKAAIERLKTDVVGSADARKDDSCSVCLCGFEEADNVVELPCKHTFHASCVTPWLEKHNSCPNCREKLPVQEGDEPESATQGQQSTTDAAALSALVQQLMAQSFVQAMQQAQTQARAQAQAQAAQAQPQTRTQAPTTGSTAAAPEAETPASSASRRGQRRAGGAFASNGPVARALRRAFAGRSSGSTSTASASTSANSTANSRSDASSPGASTFATWSQVVAQAFSSFRGPTSAEGEQPASAPSSAAASTARGATAPTAAAPAAAAAAAAAASTNQVGAESPRARPKRRRLDSAGTAEVSEAAASSISTSPQSPGQSRRREELAQLSVGTLKSLLTSLGVDFSRCIEKHELVSLVCAHTNTSTPPRP